MMKKLILGSGVAAGVWFANDSAVHGSVMPERVPVEIVGHRGASHDAPENTLAAFRLGYGQGADGCELDIYQTSDGRIVVLHDANTARTAGASNAVARETFEKLRQLDVGHWGKWKSSAAPAEKIPSLEEALALIPDGKKLFIEVKCGAEVLPELVRALKAAGKKPEQTVLIGFKLEAMRQAKALLPQVPVLWLASKDSKSRKFAPVEALIEQARAARLDGLDLESGFPIDGALVRKVHEAGLKLYTWTVDEPALARAEAAAGVDGITTNRPRWLREQLAVAATPAESPRK